MPSTHRPEVVTALLRHGYGFSPVVRRRARAGSATSDPAVPVRMLGRRAVLLGGPAGVRVFTDVDRVRRAGATPPVVGDVLFGHGAVHTLDDDAHRSRKGFFVTALEVGRARAMVEAVSARWDAWAVRVRPGRDLLVEREAARVIGRGVLDWSGAHVDDASADRVSRWWATEVDGFGVPGRPYLEARRARQQTDAWALAQVLAVRSGAHDAPPDSALGLVAAWRDEDGGLLDDRTAAVDLQNCLRPAVAVSRFVAFAALALARAPHWAATAREEVRATGRPGATCVAIAREARRRAPFVPLLAAVARHDDTLLGVPVRAGERVLLDVVGTLRDPVSWPDPMAFDPSRFLGASLVVEDALVPQGGGSVVAGHRCPGEDPSLGILAAGIAALCRFDTDLVSEDTHVNERRIPARMGDGARLLVRGTPAVSRSA